MHNEPFALLQQAVALHQRGERRRAIPLYEQVLAQEPDNGWALFFRGVAAEEEELFDAAGGYYARAAASGFGEPELLIARGGLAMKQGQWTEAVGHYEAALRIAPEIAALWHNLGLALKRLDRLSEARMVWAESMRLRRGCPADPSAILDADERRALRRANGPKLAHDLAQLRWLRAERVAGPEVEPAIAALAALAARMPETDSRLRELTETGLGAAAGIFNRLAFLADGRAVDGQPLAPEAVAALAAADGTAPEDGPVVIDDLLAPAALSRLRRFLQESTIWFEAKDHGGHVGAYLEEGLAQPLLLQLAEALQAALPRRLGHLRLAQLWGYSYAADGSGTDIHADAGTVSANLWLTPTEACLAGGGLQLYDARVPPDWRFEEVNGPAERLRSWLAETAPAARTIAYRGNRLVLFDGRAPHRTEPFRFAPGFDNRRLNLTFLFDAPDSGLAASQWH